MGMMTTEQTTEILDSVSRVIDAAHPEPIVHQSEPWWQVVAILAGAATALITAWAGYIAVKKRKGK